MNVDLETGAAPAAAETPSAVPADSAAQAAESMRGQLEAVWEKNNPPREQGKFAAREKPVETPAAPEGETVETEAKTETPDQPKETKPVEPAKPIIDMPRSWSADKKALWDAASPELREQVSRREAEAHKAITQYGQALANFRPIAELVGNYRDDFEAQKVTPVQGISYLLSMQRQFAENPVATLRQLAEQEGIDLAQLASQPAPQLQRDPEVLRLRQRLGELESHLTSADRDAQERSQAEVARIVTEFGRDKPHFEDVRQIMSALLDSGSADTLDAAYEQAVYAHPEIRKRIEQDRQKAADDQRKAEEAKRKAEAEKAAKEAKKASSLNVRSNGGASPGVARSLRESLEAGWESAQRAG